MMIKMKKYSSNQSGRSMIEMLGVLAIVGVLSVAGIAGYSKAMAKYKTNKLIDQVSTVAANVRTTFAAQSNYKGLYTEEAYSLGIFPEEVSKGCSDSVYNNGDNCLKNAFGGVWEVRTDDAIHDDWSYFEIGVDGLSKDACSALVMADWGPASAVKGLVKTSAGQDLLSIVGESLDIFEPIELKNNTVTISSDICNCSSTENNCVVVWRFQ